MTYQIVIPGRLPGLNEIIDANRRNRYAGAQQKKDAQFLIRLMAKDLPKLREPVRLDYVWYEPDRRRDWDNIMAGQKFIQDTLVEMRRLYNDGWNNICAITHEFRTDRDNPRIVVTITDAEVED